MSKKHREQNKIHARITNQVGPSLSQAEVKRHLADLFVLLLEMEIDQQNDVRKECPHAEQAE